MAWGLCLDFVLVVFPFYCLYYYGWGLCWVVGVKIVFCIRQSLF
jgi:hypothetical protein